ncbi:MAG: hypothetical protein WA874_14080 [Chryseosolibacter sp.]
MKYRFLIALAVSSLTGCSPPQKGEGENDTAISGFENRECYRFVQNQDTIRLSVRSSEGRISGRLSFTFYEKDQTHGTIDGMMKGDTLLATYAFTSEGLMSYREVAFLKRTDAFVMGTGEILNSGNRDVFKSPQTIEFDHQVVLRHVDCDDTFQND